LPFLEEPWYWWRTMPRLLLGLLVSVLMSGCLGGVAPGQRLSDAARELNLAARFGQTAVALERVDPSVRADYQLRRRSWEKELRILDVEVTAISIRDETHATVGVHFSWSSVTDSLLRSTELVQEWENRPAQGWMLVREVRAAGDTGLFGEMLPVEEPPHPDVHRPSRTIR
jgi:hypothetical protein